MDSVAAASLLIVTNYIQSFKAVVSLGQINEINSKLFPLWVLLDRNGPVCLFVFHLSGVYFGWIY